MCTVTYIPRGDSFLLASNRDENRQRPAAHSPSIHMVHGHRLLFPRDGLAGGTWIAAGETGYVVVLLNGAFEKHFSEPPYRLSRGLALLNIITARDPGSAFTETELAGIEPFTLVMAASGKLQVGRWDGKSATIENPDPRLPHIWSSVTLYPADVRARRAGWFYQWLQENPAPDAVSLTAFHQFTGDGDIENDLRMERNNGIFTNSISVLDCDPGGVQFHYLDLSAGTSSSASLPFLTASTLRR